MPLRQRNSALALSGADLIECERDRVVVHSKGERRFYHSLIGFFDDVLAMSEVVRLDSKDMSNVYELASDAIEALSEAKEKMEQAVKPAELAEEAAKAIADLQHSVREAISKLDAISSLAADDAGL